MFSGIIEETGILLFVKEQENLHLTLKCSFRFRTENRPERCPQRRVPDGGQNRQRHLHRHRHGRNPSAQQPWRPSSGR